MMIRIDRNSKLPIYQQIYEQIKKDILSGVLAEGSYISSTRALARELQVGRNSVENAYSQLVLEGYVTSIPGSGHLVNSLDLDLHPTIGDDLQADEKIRHQQRLPSKDIKYSFQYGEPDPSIFPSRHWRSYVSEVLDEYALNIHGHNDKKGDLLLRRQLKQYLYRKRGVKCDEEQIIICSGTQSALEIIIRLVSERGRVVAMENPCYDGASSVFISNDYQIKPVSVKGDGIDLDMLSKISAPLVHVAPSYQFPTGAVMPIQNRIQLLDLAHKRGMIVIEDDYDNEFLYKGKPIPSLQSIDQKDSVIYVGTFSKTLSSGLRMAYLILPRTYLPLYEKKYKGYQCTVPTIEQRVLAKFMKDGRWEKHVRRICLSQKKKHDLLIASIRQTMGDKVKIYGQQAGMHILLEFLQGQQEEVLVEKALEQGVYVHPASPFWLDKSSYKGNALILGYGRIKQKDVPKAISLLNEAWFGKV